MDRRDFIKSGAIGAAALTVGGLAPWLTPEGAFAASRMHRENGKPWKFGVMADTQWGKNLDGQNPGTCAVGIISLVNAEFIKHGVKFVIQVGDLIDQEDDTTNGTAGKRTMPVRAAAAQALYDAEIGFFPLRGNHEGSTTAANEFLGLYPQARGYGKHVHGADNFSSPFAALDGLSYSFDFSNVRFVMLDQFARADGSVFNGTTTAYLSPASTGPSTAAVGANIIDQQPWIDSSLSGRRKNSHAFVLAHKNLIGQNHVDTLFGDDPSKNPAGRNAFIGSLAKNGVRYTLGGHDHMHHRSLVTSPDGSATVKEIICSSDSYKFYYPAKPSNV
ncbi:MAG: metallophosphoesterase, partial [Coriobacteriia bacterium]|nr:metallophosphoesterase [Coriobacteriia bacterium]